MQEKIYDVPAEWAKRAHIDAAKYRTCMTLDQRPERLLGRAGQAHPLVSSPSPRSRTPPSRRATSRSNGSRTAPPTPPTTASTGISPSAPTRRRSSGRATTRQGSKHITYRELHDEVCRFANVLRNRGVEKGDRVTIYLPMIPEAAYAMLACARIGAIHSVVFGGFSPDSLAGRIEDCQSKRRHHRRRRPARRPQGAAQGQRRRGHRPRWAASTMSIVVRRTGAQVAMEPVRDVWYHEAAAMVTTECPCEEMNAEDPLFILYTSGSTGKPEGRAAYDRRLSRLRRDDAPVHLRLSRRRHLLVHRRCRLGDRPQLHSSTARSPTARRR